MSFANGVTAEESTHAFDCIPQASLDIVSHAAGIHSGVSFGFAKRRCKACHICSAGRLAPSTLTLSQPTSRRSTIDPVLCTVLQLVTIPSDRVPR